MLATPRSTLALRYLRGTGESDWSDAPDAAARRAFDLACIAVELDDRDSQAHLIVAWAYFRARSNFDLAASQVEKAITLNPNDWNNYCFKSWLLTCSGDLDGGIACANQAIQRNPLAPNECLWTIGYADYQARRYAEALSAFGRKGFPRPPDVHAFMAARYANTIVATMLALGRRSFLRNLPSPS